MIEDQEENREASDTQEGSCSADGSVTVLSTAFWGGIAIAVLGIVVGQAILYGPSLIGKKILLPLDLLAVPGSLSAAH